ncbi:MAG: O-methyltransferase [Chloroflexi bacterium]|nr:O-methyltransferase [Chloroflexota bacterium]
MDDETHAAVMDYVTNLFAQEDDAMASIKPESEEAGIPQIHIRAVEGKMMQVLIRAAGVKRMIEVGTLAGYSGSWIARALPEDGKLICLELEEKHAEFSRGTFEKLGLSHKTEVRVGKALELLEALTPDGPFDGIFIDADKDGYLDYLAWALDNLRVGGLILAHNAFLHGDILGEDRVEDEGRKRAVRGMRAFNQTLADDERLLSTVIPVRDGTAVAIKVK